MFARSTLVLLVATTTIGLSACGSSKDSGSSSSDGPLTRAQLATKADAICAKAKTDASKIVPPTDFGATGSSAEKAYEYLAQIQPITQKEATDLAALKPDSEAAADWGDVVKSQKALSDLLDSIVAKAKAKDASGLKDLAGAAAKGKPFVEATTKIGAKGCAGG